MSNVLNQTRQMTQWNQPAKANVPMSYFDLSHDHKTTFELGELIPFLTLEGLPSDEFELSAEVRCYFKPLIAPLIHRLNGQLFWFWVPNSAMWNNGKNDNWEEWITTDAAFGPPTALYDTDLVWNTINGGVNPDRFLGNYMGIPSPIVDPLGKKHNVSALPFAAYWKIWNAFFRNPIIQDEIPIELTSGEQTVSWDTTGESYFDETTFSTNWMAVKQRNWNPDFFTSATPEPQLGTEVRIPVFDQDIFDGVTIYEHTVRNSTTGAIAAGAATDLRKDSSANNSRLELTSGLEVALDTSATAGTVQQLRLALQTQEWLEKLNRSGQRYRDVLGAFFGVDPRPGQLDYAEFLGSHNFDVGIGTVMGTSGNGTGIIGDYAGAAKVEFGSKNIRYKCHEHGILMGIINIQPRSSYSQALHRMWTRTDKYDYAWPEFAQIGDQEIKNMELALDTAKDITHADNQATWGYIPRYSEYKWHNDIISGQMPESGYDFWHLGREFDPTSLLALGDNFLRCDAREQDIFEMTASEHSIICHIWNKVFVRRALPKYGIPSV